MHVKAKKMAFLGLMLAVSEVLLVLSSVLEFNTVFFLAIAAYFVGIAIRECGLRLGAAFYIAEILLGLILAPNKLYCLTLAAFGFYILFREFFWEAREKKRVSDTLKRDKAVHSAKKGNAGFMAVKYLVFNVFFIPALIFVPQLIYSGTLSTLTYVVLFAGGQVFLWIYDRAYDYFQSMVWGKYRKRFRI